MIYNPYSYQTQLKFLQGRIVQEMELLAKSSDNECTTKSFIVDRSIFEDSAVFARSQALNGLMSEEEHKKYLGFFDANIEKIRLPSLIIYLRIDPRKLYERIQKRGREMEKEISEEYLRSLQTLYDQFVKDMQAKGVEVLEVNTETRDEYPLAIDRLRKMQGN